MKNSFFKIYNLMKKKKKSDQLLKNILKMERKKKIFSIEEEKLIKKNICIQSMCMRSVYSDFYLSRMHLKKLFRLGYINGLRKAS